MMRTRDKLESYRVLAQALRPAEATGRGGRCWSATGRRGPRSRRLMAPLGEQRALRRRRAACRAAGALCRRRPLPLAGDQRSLRHGLSRSPGGRPARGRRPHRRRARGGGRRRHRLADPGRRCARPSPPPSAGCSTRRPNARAWRPPPRAASPRITTSAPRGHAPWPPRCADAAMSGVPFAILRHAATALERRAAACRASPTRRSARPARRRRDSWRLPPPADGWRRMSQPAAARAAHRRAAAACRRRSPSTRACAR